MSTSELLGLADALESVIYWLLPPSGPHGPRETVRKSAEALKAAAVRIDALQRQIDESYRRAVFCLYCDMSFTYQSGVDDIAELVARLKAHDQVCPENPVRR